MGKEHSTSNGAPRNRQMSSFPVSVAEDALIRDHVAVDGRPLTHFLREVVLEYIATHPIAKPDARLSRMRTPPARVKVIANVNARLSDEEASSQPVETSAETDNVNVRLSTMAKTPKPQSQKTSEVQRVPITRRTRERARTEEREREEQILIPIGSSLRSEQAAPAEVELPDAGGWKAVAPLKQTIRLSTGEVVNNTYVFANGWRMEAVDIARILNTPSLRVFKSALLVSFAHSVRSAYRAKYCAHYKRLQNAWRDTPRSDRAFMRAAEYLAVEYCNRGMSSGQFIDALNEMRPKSLRFIPSDLVGAMASRIESWVPPEQREATKGWTSHMDDEGAQWVTPTGEAPVIVLRSTADRERFLQANGLK